MEYLWNKYLWKITLKICGANIFGRICGIFVGQIFMEEYVEYLWMNVWNNMEQVSV